MRAIGTTVIWMFLYEIIDVIDTKNEVNRPDGTQLDRQTYIPVTNVANVKTLQTPPKIAELPDLHARREEANDHNIQHTNNPIAPKETHSEFKVSIIYILILCDVINILQ